MTPRGEPRTRKFTLVLTENERLMLDALASQSRRSASDWVRLMVVDTYKKKFGDEPPHPQK